MGQCTDSRSSFLERMLLVGAMTVLGQDKTAPVTQGVPGSRKAHGADPQDRTGLAAAADEPSTTAEGRSGRPRGIRCYSRWAVTSSSI